MEDERTAQTPPPERSRTGVLAATHSSFRKADDGRQRNPHGHDDVSARLTRLRRDSGCTSGCPVTVGGAPVTCQPLGRTTAGDQDGPLRDCPDDALVPPDGLPRSSLLPNADRPE